VRDLHDLRLRLEARRAVGTEVALARVEAVDAIIMIVTATTFLVQIIGPPCVKVAVEKAGEVGLNVTEADLVQTYAVGDVMDRTAPNFPNDMLLSAVLPAIADTDIMTYPVVDGNDKLCGVITIDDLKKSFGAVGLTDWLLTSDAMQAVSDRVTESMRLEEALTRMRELGLEYMPVVAGDDESRYVGMLELRAVNSFLSKEILRRRERASD
jgi:CBS domain-containing protein